MEQFSEIDYTLESINMLNSILLYSLLNKGFKDIYTNYLKEKYDRNGYLKRVERAYLNKLIVENRITVLKPKEIRLEKMKYILCL